ncbi:uncharacterized protein LOC111709147 [Eurytemora carolleeae]|uniref:uncharacterized protein LOC111709147 n=1 Tax=Eurytemora carolleeae TaxID=1294199 RepID=UPI000C77BCAA|nr:uncharacterized protein LOC111709147 [Eurytemora carolleeae]|eukprot:XP_023338524.1 uncharacterized protein LOC111709147 [Eurytemora affinis]
MSAESGSVETCGIWRSADRGDIIRVKQLIQQGCDVNSRNCLGCVPLMYAAGSGHLQVVEYLLEQPAICVNIRNNDRLTTFMLAMQLGGDAGGWTGVQGGGGGGGQEHLKKLMDLPSLTDADWARNDKWTVLMEAASFGQEKIVDRLLQVPGIELDAINIRGQTAQEIAINRNHPIVGEKIEHAIKIRDNPAEVVQIRELENQVEDLKTEARKRLLHTIDTRFESLSKTKEKHEAEMEPLTKEIDRLQLALDQSMKKRLAMITRQVSEVKRLEDDLKISKRQLDNFDRNTFIYIYIQIVRTCPTCRVPLGPASLLRNIPMEKLAKTYFERCSGATAGSTSSLLSPLRDFSRHSSRRSSGSGRTISQGTPTWAQDDLDSRIFDWTQ